MARKCQIVIIRICGSDANDKGVASYSWDCVSCKMYIISQERLFVH